MWTLAVLMSLSTCGVHEFCREKFKFVYSFSCPSSELINMMYCSVNYCCSNSSIPGVILHSIMKSIKILNHPAYHWSTLWPLEVWVRGQYNSLWFCVHKLSMFLHLSMNTSRLKTASTPIFIPTLLLNRQTLHNQDRHWWENVINFLK